MNLIKSLLIAAALVLTIGCSARADDSSNFRFWNIDELCQNIPNTIICSSPTLRDKYRITSGLEEQIRIRLQGAALQRFRASINSFNETVTSECMRPTNEERVNCAARWMDYLIDLHRRELASLTAPPPPAPRRNEIPLLRWGESYLVNATVNDSISVNFTLDTGAEDVSISEAVAARLGLTARDVVDYVIVTDANGGSKRRPVVILRNLNVGGNVLHNVEATVGNSTLLGQPFLRKFHSYTIDNHRNVLILG